MGLIPVEPLGELLWWWFAQIDLAKIGDGSNIPQINHGDVEPLRVPIPPHEEQQVLTRLLKEQFSIMRRVETGLASSGANVERLQQALLAKAFRGDLVPQDPADEPASVLLERIKAEREATVLPPKATAGNKRPKRVA